MNKKVEPVEKQVVQHVQQQMPVYAPRSQAAWPYDLSFQNAWDQQAFQPPQLLFVPPPEARSEYREQLPAWADDRSMSQVPDVYWRCDSSWQYQ